MGIMYGIKYNLLVIIILCSFNYQQCEDLDLQLINQTDIPNMIKLQWTTTTTNITYTVEYCWLNNICQTTPLIVNDNNGCTRSVTKNRSAGCIRNLHGNTNYSIKVTSIDRNGETLFEANVTTPTYNPSTSYKIGLETKSTNVSDKGFSIEWSDICNYNNTSYNIELCNANTTLACNSINVTNMDIKYTFTDLEPSTKYYYTVENYKDGLVSCGTVPTSVTTSEASTTSTEPGTTKVTTPYLHRSIDEPKDDPNHSALIIIIVSIITIIVILSIAAFILYKRKRKANLLRQRNLNPLLRG